MNYFHQHEILSHLYPSKAPTFTANLLSGTSFSPWALYKTHHMQILRNTTTHAHIHSTTEKIPAMGNELSPGINIHTYITEISHYHRMQNIYRNAKLNKTNKHINTTISLKYGPAWNSEPAHEVMIHIHTTFNKPSVSDIAQPKQRTM